MTRADSIALQIWEFVGLIGWVFVWGGCLGEGLAEFTKFPKDEKRRHKLGKISWFVLLAGLALEFLGTVRATRIKDIEVARLRSEASVANQAAADAQRDAASARLEGEKLKALVAWRELSATQRDTFRALTRHAPKGRIVVSSVAENAEAANFARQIGEMLTYSGYSVSENFGARTSFGPPDLGVFIEVGSLDFSAPHGVPVQQALEAIGISAPARQFVMEPNAVTIFVGSKPTDKRK